MSYLMAAVDWAAANPDRMTWLVLTIFSPLLAKYRDVPIVKVLLGIGGDLAQIHEGVTSAKAAPKDVNGGAP